MESMRPHRRLPRRTSTVAGATTLLLLGWSFVMAWDDSAPTVPPLATVPALIDGCFATSPTCAMCHSSSPDAEALRDASGRSVAPYDLWQSSMMANSSRDPLWRAMVSTEVAENPKAKREIEAKCMRCHAPMASVEKEHSGTTLTLDELYDPSARHNELALDGVSCTACHQIEPDRLGTPESFNGRFHVASKAVVYGPHRSPFAMPMLRVSEFTPTFGSHLSESALCGTCHTLTTHALGDDGKPNGSAYLEQSPYLEWRNSVFNDEHDAAGPDAASCQDCHVPTTDQDGAGIRTRIARTPGGFDFPPIREREPVGRHIFVGGNTLVPAILRDHADELNSLASSEAFDATIAAARRQLREKTVQLEVTSRGVKEAQLLVDVALTNLVGHKFPSGHPTRRAWIRLTVRDADGAVIFASGDHDQAGRIRDADSVLASEERGGPVQPHYDVITKPSQVQIYEVVMEDASGEVTFGLMRAAGNRKDNRLLPRGWRPDHPDGPATSPVGVNQDSTFRDGRDVVQYRIDVGQNAGPYTVEAEVLYQTLGSRFAAELRRWKTPEVETFFRYYDATPHRFEPIAKRTLRVEPNRDDR